MKTSKNALLAALVAVPVLLAAPPVYTIAPNVVAGGGGDASGGRYSVSTTIGQVAAAEGVAGHFSIASGYWAALVRSDGTPDLVIERTGGVIRISWDSPDESFRLEQSKFVNGIVWGSTEQNRFQDGNHFSVTITPDGTAHFFRLRK